MKTGKLRMCMIVAAVFACCITEAGSALAQTAEQPAPAVPAVQEDKTGNEIVKAGAPLNTENKLRLQLEGYLGFGLDSITVGVTSGGEDVKISGGGGFGGGATLGYGLSQHADIDLTLGAQASVLTPAVENATGTFGRSFLLATMKYKIPVRDNLQWKFGAGIGYYMGGKLDIDIDQGILNGGHWIVEYKNATGFHATGELEVALQRNLVLAVGLKYYAVDFKADTATFNGVSVPVSSVSSGYRELNGDGVDITVGFGVLF